MAIQKSKLKTVLFTIAAFIAFRTKSHLKDENPNASWGERIDQENKNSQYLGLATLLYICLGIFYIVTPKK